MPVEQIKENTLCTYINNVTIVSIYKCSYVYIVFYINVIVQLNTSFINVPNILGLELVPVQRLKKNHINIACIEARQPLLASGLWTPEGEAATALQEGGEPVLQL